MEETQARLTEEFSVICRDYCDISWGKVLDVAGVPVDSDLRQPKTIYYDLEIRELSGLDSSHPEQTTQVSAQLEADQVPPAPLEAPKDSHQDAGKGKEIEALKGWIKVRIRSKILLIPQKKPQIPLSLNSTKLLTQGSPRRRLRLGGFYYFCMFFVVSF